MGTGGKLTTHAINDHRAGLARENFKRAGVEKMVTLVMGDAHETVKRIKEPIDVLFLDADKGGYIDYINKLLPRVRPGGLILAHNTTDLGGMMQDYIKFVSGHPELETIFVHKHDRGIGVTMKKRMYFPVKSGGRADAAGPCVRPADDLPPKPSEDAVLGYIGRMPDESPACAAERHHRVAERRTGHPIIFHRGAVRKAVENTLECYSRAIDMGADGVEIDIHRTKDGVLVLHHDDSLGRTFNGDGKIKKMTYYELLQATPKSDKGLMDETTRIPTLASFRELARRRAMLIHLDVKQSGVQDDIIAMIEEADMWDHLVEVNGGNADKIRPDTWSSS
jgi:hypothetical protein